MKSRGGLTRGRRVRESVRLIWLKVIHHCAEIHNSLSSLISLLHVSSEQHVELGVRRHNIDLQEIISRFHDHKPFSITGPILKSLSTGNAETVGENTQKSFDNPTVEETKISQKDQTKTLDTL